MEAAGGSNSVGGTQAPPTAPLRVLHVCQDFYPGIGGIEKFVQDLCRHSRELGIDARVLCLNRIHGSNVRLPKHDEVEGIPIRRVPFLNLKYYKPAILPIAELKTADLLHVHGVGALMDYAVLTKWRHRRPIVLSTHGGIFHTNDLLRFKRIYFASVHRMLERLVDQTVAASRQDLELFRGIAKNLVLLENGADLSRFRQCEIDRKDTKRLVYVGRLARNKRVDLLIDAFARLAGRDRALQLRIVGHDWEDLLVGLKVQAKRLGVEQNVTFTGGVPDAQLAEELCSAAWFASASEYEGFGISAIEAMAAGCVPILNDIYAFRNIITDGDTGVLVDYTKPEAAAERMRSVLATPPGEMARRARARTDEFAWERKAVEWLRLYQGVLGREGAATGEPAAAKDAGVSGAGKPGGVG
jgi:alpha-1,3-mannosyltransferase